MSRRKKEDQSGNIENRKTIEKNKWNQMLVLCEDKMDKHLDRQVKKIKKERKHKLTASGMRKVTLLQILQAWKEYQENIVKNFMPTYVTNKLKWIHFLKDTNY